MSTRSVVIYIMREAVTMPDLMLVLVAVMLAL
jgi:hypothetical protein